MSRQNNNSPVPQEVIQNIDIVANNNNVAAGVGDNDSHGYSTE